MKIGILFFLVFVILVLGIVSNVFGLALPQQKAPSVSQLEILFYSAPQPIDWRSPTTLVRTTIQNSLTSIELPQHDHFLNHPDRIYDQLQQQIYQHSITGQSSYNLHPHPISHVNVRLHCAGKSEKMLGSTGKQSNAEYLQKLLFEGAAMETIIENTQGGMYSTAQVRSLLPGLKARGWVHSLRYDISSSLCEHIDRYLIAYEVSGQNKIYGGLQTEPLQGLGAGCSAFGMSVLKVAGLYDRVFDQWFQRTLRIPHEIMNLSSAPARYNFYDLFFGNYRSWAEPHQPHVKITFWDPQLMYQWVQDLASHKAFWWRDHSVSREGESFVVHVDAREVIAPKQQFQFSKSHLARIKAEVQRLWAKR